MTPDELIDKATEAFDYAAYPPEGFAAGDGIGSGEIHRGLRSALEAVGPAIRAQLALNISNAILAARADDIGDGYHGAVRIREQDAAIARQVGGVDGLEEFAPREDA